MGKHVFGVWMTGCFGEVAEECPATQIGQELFQRHAEQARRQEIILGGHRSTAIEVEKGPKDAIPAETSGDNFLPPQPLGGLRRQLNSGSGHERDA